MCEGVFFLLHAKCYLRGLTERDWRELEGNFQQEIYLCPDW